MKKTLFTLALVAGLTGAAQAQHSNVSLGLKAGGTLSNFVGDQAKNYKNMFGFHAGVFANIGISNLFAFQPELIYSQKGAEVSNIDVSTHLNYLDIPLAFHINAEGLFFEAGPQIGILLAANDKSGNVTVDQKSLYNTADVGYLFGLGYQRKKGPGIGLRYNGGFTNVEKSRTLANVTVQNNIRNSAFQLYVTYSFSGR
jgi:hypothetical protein